MANKRGINYSSVSNSQRRFWIGFVTILLLSVAIIIIETPSITGASSVQTISFLKEGSNFDAEIRNIDNVKSYTTTVIKDTKNAKILFQERFNCIL